MRPRLAQRAALVVAPLLVASLASVVAASAPPAAGAAAAPLPGQAGPTSPTPPGAPGYWMAAGNGTVFTYGTSRYEGGAAGLDPTPVVAMARTPTGAGYWLAAADGAVFSFGDAPYEGGANDRAVGSAPIVAMAPTPTGLGYWLFASDGSVQTKGDALYWGSPPPTAIHAPIVAAAATPDGQGYWIVAANGAVYPEGDAAAIGDASDVNLGAPIVGIAATASGRGYWLVGADGGVLTYGDAAFHGSVGGKPLQHPIVGIAATPSGGGYWLFGADGSVVGFGDAPGQGLTNPRPLVLGSIVAVASPAPAHGTGVAIFYYPWYGNPQNNGEWRHWDEGGHSPPADIGSNYYPQRGAYSSTDPTVLAGQMTEIANAGINEIIVSWWGQGSFEDNALPGVIAAARAAGVQVGIHLEPYQGRTAQSVMSDYGYLAKLGITDIWVYMADLLSGSGLAADNAAFPSLRTMGESGHVSFVKSGGFATWASQAGFKGVYLYDAINYEAADFPAFCAAAHAYGLICAPVAAPGFIAVRATGAHYGRARDGGLTYDSRWMGDIGASADVVAITSYNEWHEGTQIEPAIPMCLSSTFCYLNYEGDYGSSPSSGAASADAYLARTYHWTSELRATVPKPGPALP